MKNTASAFLRGFTLIEVIVVIAVIGILVVISSVSFISFRKDSDVSGAAEEIVAVLRMAKSKSLSGADGEKHGVSFEVGPPYTYTLFRISNPPLPDPPVKTNLETYSLPEDIKFEAVNLVDGDVTFDKLTGNASETGDVSIQVVSDPTKTYRIYISSAGQISSAAEVPGNDADRVKDSRHVHVAYSRPIDTATESIVLDFGAATQTIVIAENFSGSVFEWEGDIDVAGAFQHIKIHAHRLNSPDTLFSIHRDRRYNTEDMEIEIDGTPTDPDTGSIISYDENGQTTQGTSVHASAPEWQ